MKNIFSLLILLSLFFPVASGLAQSQKPLNKQPMIDLLTQLYVSYGAVNDFTATMRLESFETNYGQHKYQQQNQKLWFKKPGYLLLEQLGPFKKGARLSILPSGLIKGHLGGFLSFAVVTLDKDDKNLYGITHDSALNTDYDKMLDIAMTMLPTITAYSIKRIMIEGKESIVLSTLYSPDSQSNNGLKIDKTRLIIDSTSMLIVGLERYRKDKLIHNIVWTNVEINIGIKKTRFDL